MFISQLLIDEEIQKMYINTNHITQQSQQKHLKSNQLHPWTELDPVGELEKKTIKKRSFIDWLIRHNRLWRLTEPSQAYIASKLKVTRETINRWVKELVEEGILSYIYRHRRTCVYYVNDFFRQPHIRKKLKHLLPSITMLGLPVSLILSAFQAEMSHQVIKRYIKRDLNNVSYYLNLSLTNNINIKDAPGTRDAQEGAPLSLRPKGKRDMFDINHFKQYLKKLTKLNTSTWGAIKLSAFSNEVILRSWIGMQTEEPSVATYQRLWRACASYCQTHGITPNLEQVAIRAQSAACSWRDALLEDETPQATNAVPSTAPVQPLLSGTITASLKEELPWRLLALSPEELSRQEKTRQELTAILGGRKRVEPWKKDWTK